MFRWRPACGSCVSDMASISSTLQALSSALCKLPLPAGDARKGQQARSGSRSVFARACIGAILALTARSAQAQERTDAAVVAPVPVAPAAPAAALPAPAAPTSSTSSTPSTPPAATGSASDPTASASVASADFAGLRAALEASRCHPPDVLELGGRWYAACGQAGVVVFARTPGGFALIERRTALGDVRAVFERNGLVWVEVQRNEARPFSELGAVTAATQPAPLALPAGTTPSLPDREPGDRAESILAPPRIAKSLAFEFALRPYLPIDELAFAAVGQLGVSYRGERPWYVQGQLYPIGGLVGKGRERGLFGAFASGGYDHSLFSVGVGIGALRGTTETWFDYYGDSVRAPEHSFAFSVTQSVRLGALDGLHMAVTNAFVLEDDRWQFGFVDVLLQAPTGRRTWIVVDGGGGGYARFFYGEVGLRRLVRGDRGQGALFVRPSVGAAGVEADDGGLTGGPMVGIHLELRR